MDDTTEDTEKTSYDIARVILGRGRRVDLYGYILRHPDELTKGVLVAGSIGSGKTQRAMKIISAAVESGYGVLVFDPSGDHSRLVSVHPDAVVLDFREFILNPLEPPTGMRMDEWASTFIQVFSQNYGLKDPSIAILQKAVKVLTSAASSKADCPPTMKELLEEVRQYNPRPRSTEVSSHASVQNRLESLLDSEIGRPVSVQRGFQPTDLEKGLLVVQLPSSGITRAHELLVGMTIAKLFAYRAWRRTRCDEQCSRILIVLEEAHNYLSEARRADRRGERSHLERALIEGRKLDIGFMVVDQMPQQISSHVLGSCNMWIVGKLLDPDAKRVIREALCLDEVWSRTGLISLPTGAAFVRVEHMSELESLSPLEHRKTKDITLLSGTFNLPALVAVPDSETDLIPEISPLSLKNLMCSNQRYLSYFRRYVQQYIESVGAVFPEHIIRGLERFTERAVSGPASHSGTIAEYCGLTSEDKAMLLGRKQSDGPTGPSMSLRSQIHDLEIRCRILSSEVDRSILIALESSTAMSTVELNDPVKKSRSWLNRSLNELETRGCIRRKSKSKRGHAIYELTPHGREVLAWARTVVLMNQSAKSGLGQQNCVRLKRDTFDWLLEHLRDELEAREQTCLAGCRGSDEVLDSLRNLEFRVETIEGMIAPETNLNKSIEGFDIFDRLLSGMESQVLAILLKTGRPVSIADLPRQCKITSRSIRRHLSLLEDTNIVRRQKTERYWNVSVDESWKQLLLDDCDPSKKQVRLTLSIIRTMLEHAIDSVFIELLVENHKTCEVANSVMQQCLEIEEQLKSCCSAR